MTSRNPRTTASFLQACGRQLRSQSKSVSVKPKNTLNKDPGALEEERFRQTCPLQKHELWVCGVVSFFFCCCCCCCCCCFFVVIIIGIFIAAVVFNYGLCHSLCFITRLCLACWCLMGAMCLWECSSAYVDGRRNSPRV